MRPNPKTGELVLASGTVLSSQLTRSLFLSSVEGSRAEVSVKNEPWCSFRFRDGEGEFWVILFFREEELNSIHLALADPKYGTGWDDWSEAKERERKAAHDRWLTRTGWIPGQKYSWGSVWSEYDPKSGSSMIVIRYQNDG
jgi:hypothetical protein